MDTYQRLGSKVSRRSWGSGGTGEIKPLKHTQGSLFNLSSSTLRLDIEARTRNTTHLAGSHRSLAASSTTELPCLFFSLRNKRHTVLQIRATDYKEI